uniref:ATP synthase subunit a n=2 Tax=Silene conica TaxID=39875 RepID=G8E8X8_SILCO|nr:ATPase subunit 6 [Silene conica]
MNESVSAIIAAVGGVKVACILAGGFVGTVGFVVVTCCLYRQQSNLLVDMEGAVQRLSETTGRQVHLKSGFNEITLGEASSANCPTLQQNDIETAQTPLEEGGSLPYHTPALAIEAPSPLEPFAIIPSTFQALWFMLLTLSSILPLLPFVTKKGGGKLVLNVWQSIVELLYNFVLNLVNEQIGGFSGNVKQRFFPCILVTFTFLLFRNLQGMIPYSFTVTSHFLVTLGLSFSIFIGITIVGFQRNGLHFLSFLLPSGVPLPLAPFLVLLELISHCFRALSLGIRLFANMMAGHSLVKILSGFAWTMLCMHNLLYFIGDLGPFFIVLALTGLELGVAILQAYVFTILICIYLNDAINLH